MKVLGFSRAERILHDKKWIRHTIASSMKTIAFVRLILVVIFLAAFRLAAQSAASTATNASEVLPAESPYGEAILIRDIPYADHPTTNQNFNLYLPKDKSVQPFPLVIWIHG